ncbi:MAG: dihydroorotase family protein, partial [Deltaproteobacteria bacterium]|nr:dihydroorotase family protein [Deltaproteobacteria bacterium]
MALDLKIEHGAVVIPGAGIVHATVGVKHGRIVHLGDASGETAARTVNARGLHVLPGVVDPHVHLGTRSPFELECESETRAALAGGVTTLGVYLRQLAGSYLESFPQVLETATRKASTDFFFHVQLFTRAQLAEVPRYARELGIPSIKMYLCGLPGILPSVDDAFLLEGFRLAARLAGEGFPAVAAVHAENEPLVNRAWARISAEKGEGGTLADWAEVHSAAAEEEAVLRSAYLARVAGAPLYAVHLTSGAALARLRRLRLAQQPLYVEVTSVHLSLTSDDPMGLCVKRYPPVRGREDVEALWAGVARGDVDVLATDNVTGTREQNRGDQGFLKASGGFGSLGVHLPLILHEGHYRRRIPVEVLVDRMARRPAQIFGLYPRKGTIAVGADADLVLVDLKRSQAVE